MDAVKRGGDRQELHEHIRELSVETGYEIKAEGKENHLFEKIAKDPILGVTLEELEEHVRKPENYVGRAPQQTEDFLNDVVAPVLAEYENIAVEEVEINV